MKKYSIKSISSPANKKFFPVSLIMKETKDERTIKNHTKYHRVWKKQETAAEKFFERQKLITKGLPENKEK